jgi:hypothetical protein
MAYQDRLGTDFETGKRKTSCCFCAQVPCSPGINPKYGEPGGSEYIFYNDIIGRVRETQPQVVLSGEDCSGWVSKPKRESTLVYFLRDYFTKTGLGQA